MILISALSSNRRPATPVAALVLLFASGCGPKPNPASPVPPAPPPSAATIANPSPPAKSSPTAALPASPDEVKFTDISAQAHIDWTHFSGARDRKYMPEIETPGCAFIDYDSDGKPDILLLNGADWPEVKSGRKQSRSALYHNEGRGTFKDVTKEAGLDAEIHTMGVAVGDFDNDGFDDIFVTCILGPSKLFKNDGHGHFKDVAREAGVDNEGHWGSGCAWVDYDKDGKLDLVVGNYCKWTPETDVKCTVYQGKKSYCTPNVYDGDAPRLFHNEGTGKFKEVTKEAGLLNLPGKTWGVTILDYDDDGWPDIAFANDMEPNCLFHNERNGTFKEVGLEAGIALGENGTAKAGMGLDAGDVDGTGLPSLLVTNFTGEGISLFRNLGKEQFLESSHQLGVSDPSMLLMGWGAFLFDYDLDGRLDALVSNGHLYENVQAFQPGVSYKEPPLLFHNEGGSFRDVASSHGPDIIKPMVGRGSAFADIDGDGDLDVLLTENDGKARLLRNDGGDKNEWLRVHLTGTKSNRDGIGAKLVAEVGGVKLTRWVKSSASFLSCSELTVTFGLGKAEKVDKLTITWPSGTVDTYIDVKPRQVLQASEGAKQ
jgi:hypothetical protein